MTWADINLTFHDDMMKQQTKFAQKQEFSTAYILLHYQIHTCEQFGF